MKHIKQSAGLLTVLFLFSLLPTVAFAKELPFQDVSETDYYFDAVSWAVEQEITSGTSATTFSPNATCTRGQMVVFLWHQAGNPSAHDAAMPFSDVDPDAYYYQAVAWAVQHKITAGTSATTFSPNDTLTRAQTMTFLWNSVGSPAVSSSAMPFNDVSLSAYYYQAVTWAVQNSITAGTSATTFSPSAPCTRAQVVTFLFRYANLSADIPAAFEAHNTNSMRYWLYTPANPTENMPLIVYLHGGSGKGDDLNLITAVDGFPKYLQDGTLGDVRAYVLIPQLSANQRGWAESSDSVYALIQSIVSEYSINAENISLTGHSMGGTGTWNLSAMHPELFSRVAPLSGSVRVTETTVQALHNTPIWAFVGSADTIVSPDSSQQMVEAIQQAGGSAKLTVFDGADHFSVPSLTYLDQTIDLIAWLTGA